MSRATSPTANKPYGLDRVCHLWRIPRSTVYDRRHDHGSRFTAHAYQDEVRFLGIRSSPSYVREPEGNGCAERFVRTLKEQLLWVRRFETLAELLEALQEFRRRYNERWLVQRHGHKSPSAVRRELAA